MHYIHILCAQMQLDRFLKEGSYSWLLKYEKDPCMIIKTGNSLQEATINLPL